VGSEVSVDLQALCTGVPRAGTPPGSLSGPLPKVGALVPQGALNKVY
jgi:hypothetical protein